jgi:hypothetical protein
MEQSGNSTEKSQGIVIATSEATKDFLPILLKSLEGVNYPILIVGNNGFNIGVNITNTENEFECGAIRHAPFDEFIFLMDTCEIKDKSFIEDVFNTPGSVYFMENFFSYLGKFEREHLGEIPQVRNKQDAVNAESGWLQQYKLRSNAQPYKQLLPHATSRIETMFGDERCVIENDFIIKRKKYWGQRPLD